MTICWLGDAWDWFVNHATIVSSVVSAIATAFIAYFTITLAGATEKMRVTGEKQSAIAEQQTTILGAQTDVLIEQKQISRQEFLATHAPRIDVEFVRRLPLQRPDVDAEEQSIAVEFRIVNNGGSDAFITGSRAQLGFFKYGEWPTPDEFGPLDPIIGPGKTRRRLSAGRSDRVIVETDAHGGLREALENRDEFAGSPDHSFLSLVGWIVYEDGLSNPRTTYFCRVWNSGKQRFDRAEGTDYERS